MACKIAVIIPIYNAEKTLVSIFERLPEDVFNKINEFILINDGSKDNTQKAIDNLKLRYRNLVVITCQNNLGYGAAQKLGFKQAILDNIDISVLLHADGQYPPENIKDMIEPIEERKADIVCGSKFLKGNVLKQGMPIQKYIGQILLNIFENFIFKQKLTTYHSGYRAFSKRALESINFESYSNYFSFDTEILVGAFINNLKIYEVPIPTYYGQEKSYLDPFRYVWGILVIMLRYLLGRYRKQRTEVEWQI